MARLGAQERREFLTIRELCRSERNAHALLGKIGSRLRRFVGGDAFCAMELDPATALPMMTVEENWPDDSHAPLVEHAMLRSPCCDPPRVWRLGRRIVEVEQLLGAAPAAEDPYFQYHLLPYGFSHEVQLLCALHGRPQAYLCISRRTARGRFAAASLRLLDALAPHFATAIHAARVRRSLASGAGSRTGLIVLSDTGRIDLTNDVGEQWLRQEVRGSFGAWHMALPLVASLARRRQMDEATPPQTSIEVTHPALAGRYRLTAERMRNAGGNWCTGILVEPVAPGDDLAKLLDLGLTAREAEVALCLIRGDARRDIAIALACSEHTVGDHIRSIGGKLGTGDRLGLVRALLGGAPRP